MHKNLSDFLFVFDVGGVVVRGFSVWPRIADLMGFEPKIFYGDFPKMNSKFWEMMQDLERGVFSGMEFLKRFAQMEGLAPPKENYWETLFAPQTDAETDALLAKLKQEGCRLIAATNTIAEHYQVHIKRNDYRRFDEVYASHLIKRVKPAKDFWEYILEKENEKRSSSLKPLDFKDMFFFDDMQLNIDGAKNIGVQAFLFKDAKNAAAQITDLTGIVL